MRNFLFLAKIFIRFHLGSDITKLKYTSKLDMQKAFNHRFLKVNYQLTCWNSILFQHESTPLFSSQKIHLIPDGFWHYQTSITMLDSLTWKKLLIIGHRKLNINWPIHFTFFFSTWKCNFLFLAKIFIRFHLGSDITKLKYTSKLDMQKVFNHRSRRVNYQLICWICILFQHESKPLLSSQKIH